MILLASVSEASLSCLNYVTSAERAVYETGAEEECIFSNRWLSFLPLPPPNAATQKIDTASTAYFRSNGNFY